MSQWATEQRRREVELAADRTIEILESFRAVNRRLCDELLECLGKLGPAELFQLFGRPSSELVAPPQAPAAEQTAGCPAAAPYKPYCDMTVPERMLHDLKHARHDENGRRLNPGRSAFEDMARNSERPRPRFTHWSS
jgi:hypothetical protein